MTKIYADFVEGGRVDASETGQRRLRLAHRRESVICCWWISPTSHGDKPLPVLARYGQPKQSDDAYFAR
jgi:hypothetical protein